MAWHSNALFTTHVESDTGQENFLPSCSLAIWKAGPLGHYGRRKREVEEAHGHLAASAWCDPHLFHSQTIGQNWSYDFNLLQREGWETQGSPRMSSLLYLLCYTTLIHFTDKEPKGSR